MATRPLRGAFQISLHDEIRLVDFLQSAGLLTHRHRQRTQPHRPAREFVDQRFDHAFIHLVETVRIDVPHRQCGVGHLAVDPAVGAHLREITHPAQQVVGDARRAPCPARDFQRPRRVGLDVDQPRAPLDDVRQVFRRVIIQPAVHPEARPQRRGDHPRARRRAHQREFRQVQPHAPGVRPLVDDDVEFVVLHRRIQVLLNRCLEPVDFVDKENVATFQGRQQSGQVARLFDHRPAGALDVGAHRLRDDVSQRGFAQSGRAGQQHVLQHIPASLGGGDEQLQPFAHLILPGKLAESRGPQRDVERRVGRFVFFKRLLHRDEAGRYHAASDPSRLAVETGCRPPVSSPAEISCKGRGIDSGGDGAGGAW